MIIFYFFTLDLSQTSVSFKLETLNHLCVISVVLLCLQDLVCLFDIYLSPLQNQTFLSKDEVRADPHEAQTLKFLV